MLIYLGLPLLPLTTGEFTVFSSREDSDHIYVTSDTHPASILPMLQNQFADVSNKIDDQILEHLKKMAIKGMNFDLWTWLCITVVI